MKLRVSRSRRFEVEDLARIMVSRCPPNPVEKAKLAWIPRPNSPLENTPHNTGVVSVALMAAPIALFQMTAERRGSTKLDGCHDASLC